MTTISSALVFTFALKYKVPKHQFYSLVIMSICLILISIVEFIYQIKVNSILNLFIDILLIYICFAFIALIDTIEKYITDFDHINPMLILIIESSFGIMLSFIYSTGKNIFAEIIKFYNELEIGKFILLIFLLFLLNFFSAGVNVYKLYSMLFFPPMNKYIALYVLNPIVIIITYYFEGNDFLYEGKPNFIYLIINVILEVILGFFGLVYSEFLILYCFGFDREAYIEISKRSASISVSFDLNNILESDRGSEIEEKGYIYPLGKNYNK